MKKTLVFAAIIITINITGQNVGIGITNPAHPLNFASTTGNKISLWGTGANHYGFGIQANLLQIYSETSGTDIAFGYGNSNAFTENMRIKGNGNVGIGTANPVNRLSITGGMNIDNNDANAGTVANTFRFGGGSSGEAIGSRRTAGANQWGLDFYTNSIARMSITNSGFIGIGTTNPSAALDINGDLNIENRLYLNNSSGNMGQALVSGGPSSSPAWRFTSFGNNQRILFKTASGMSSTSSFSDTILYDAVNMQGNFISYSNNGVFTINNSGLYAIESILTAFNVSSSGPNLPVASLFLFIKYPPGPDYTQVIVCNENLEFYTGNSAAGSLSYNQSLYFPSGTQFYLFGSISNAPGGSSCGFYNNRPLSIYLISE